VIKTRIALVTEGKSEHWIIKDITQKYFKGQELFIRQIQPQIVDNKQEEIGGWLEVLKFCQRTSDLRAALIESDYLIIQIDTDESNNPNFDVPHTKDGGITKTNDELFVDIIDKIDRMIDAQLENEYRDKIIYAICIHSIECWLLPILSNNKRKSNIRNCFSTLNSELRKKNLATIPSKKQKDKRQIIYFKILSNWKKKKDIIDASKNNVGFANFIKSLNKIELPD
jgi:hypothetical protein